MGQTTRRDEVNIWKGWGILAVVLIHAVSYFYPYWYLHQAIWKSFVVLDQLSRFCVPLFIFLSGLTLTWRYSEKLNLAEFYGRRLLKILPLYAFWSVLIFFVLHAVPGWAGPINFSYPWWKIFVWGQADYQLYFVSLIFQFYLLFPLLLWLVKKFSGVTLLTALVVQLWFFNFLFAGKWSDQEQYVIFLSWIFYFVLGIYLAKNYHYLINLKRNARWFLLGSLLVSFYVLVKDCFRLIDQRENLNVATSFTRIPVIAFCFFTILNLIAFASAINRLSAGLKRFFLWLGKESFLIFLSHTLVLRVVFDHWSGQHDPLVLVWVLLIVVVGIVVSKINFSNL